MLVNKWIVLLITTINMWIKKKSANSQYGSGASHCCKNMSVELFFIPAHPHRSFSKMGSDDRTEVA